MRRLFYACACVVLVAGLAACGGSDDDSGGDDAAAADGGGGCGVEARTIGVVNGAQTSETLNSLAEAFPVAAEEIGWEANVLNGEITPTRWGANVDQLVQEQVDAIVLVGFDPVAISPQVEAARTAGIPVFATIVPLPDESAALVDGAYSNDFTAMGELAGDYAVERTDAPVGIAQEVLVTEGVQDFVLGAESVMEAAGGSIAERTDLDVTQQPTSYAQNATAMVRNAPDASFYISGSDNAAVYAAPALAEIGRDDVTIIIPHDNPSTIAQIQDGDNVVATAANTERIAFEVVDVLADHYENDADIPATYPDDDFQTVIVDAENVPSDGARAFPVEEQAEPFRAKWSEEYGC